MKTSILVLFVCAVSNIQCLYNSKQEYTRIKRAKYNYPSKFYKLPPSSSHVNGPFSYTPPPGYMSDSGPPPGSLKAYKVSKKPNNGLGDEDIHNLFKYLSKQDLNKIVELAVEKDRIPENKPPYLDKNNYEYGSHIYENQEQRPFYKEFDDDWDSRSPLNLKDDNIEYSRPYFNSYEDTLHRITRNNDGLPNNNFDYPQELAKDITPNSNFNFHHYLSKNFNSPPSSNFDFERDITTTYNNQPNENYDYPPGSLNYGSISQGNVNYAQGITTNLKDLINENVDYSEAANDYNSPKIGNLNYPQEIIDNDIQQKEIINYPLGTNKNTDYSQKDCIESPLRIAKSSNTLQNDQYNYYLQHVKSNSSPSRATLTDSQETLTYNDLQNYSNYYRQTRSDGDLTAQNELLFLDNYIQKEMSKQKPITNMFNDIKPQMLQYQTFPKPINPHDQDYEISYTNNVPQVVSVDKEAYKAENFADLPLMNYDDSKLDTVNSYNVPHYTVTQVKANQQIPVKILQSPAELPKSTFERATPRSVGQDQSDAHLKAIKIWTHKSKGMAYTLHKDGTLSPEWPIRPIFKQTH